MVTLDGFMEGPNRKLDWHVIDEDFNRYGAEMLNSIAAMLLGRVTYQLFANYWPSATEPEAHLLNKLPKIVFSRTLEKVEWNNSRLVKENIASGTPMFKDIKEKITLKLVKTETFRSGVVVLYYQSTEK